MSLIKIPYIAQPKRSPKCGAACIAMLVKYFQGTRIDIELIWKEVKADSPEFDREYCKTYKLGGYTSKVHFRCSVVRYTSLKTFLDFCISQGTPPIINHVSFEDGAGGHFSIVKNFLNDTVIINDPENKSRVSVSLEVLEKYSIKRSENQEIGGNTALVPAFLFPEKYRDCPYCGNFIDQSFSSAANSQSYIVDEELCLRCDKFSKS